MAKQELLGEVKKLITMGKEKGFLTYDELNNTLPAEVVSSDQFGSIMTMFGELDIEIVDAPDGERTQKRTETPPPISRPSKRYFQAIQLTSKGPSPSNDHRPVKRQMPATR